MVLSCGLLFYQPLRHVLVVVEEITSFLMELREREKNFFIVTLGLDSTPPVHSWLPKKILFFIFVTCAFGFFLCGKNRVDVQRPKIAEKSVIFFPQKEGSERIIFRFLEDGQLPRTIKTPE